MSLKSILTNKHTSGAAVLYGLAAAVGHIADVWFPEHSSQTYKTVLIVKELAIGWMGFGAGDAKTVKTLGEQVQRSENAIRTGDTTHLEKPPEVAKDS